MNIRAAESFSGYLLHKTFSHHLMKMNLHRLPHLRQRLQHRVRQVKSRAEELARPRLVGRGKVLATKGTKATKGMKAMKGAKAMKGTKAMKETKEMRVGGEELKIHNDKALINLFS
jgi:hypothetical protein